jgi:hypothetical protein
MLTVDDRRIKEQERATEGLSRKQAERRCERNGSGPKQAFSLTISDQFENQSQVLYTKQSEEGFHLALTFWRFD